MFYPWSIWYLLKPKKSPLNPRDYPSQSKTRENGPSSPCIQNRTGNTKKKKKLKKKGFVYHANVHFHRTKNKQQTKKFSLFFSCNVKQIVPRVSQGKKSYKFTFSTGNPNRTSCINTIFVNPNNRRHRIFLLYEIFFFECKTIKLRWFLIGLGHLQQ